MGYSRFKQKILFPSPAACKTSQMPGLTPLCLGPHEGVPSFLTKATYNTGFCFTQTKCAKIADLVDPGNSRETRRALGFLAAAEHYLFPHWSHLSEARHDRHA
jgi:hypothetical protein